MKNETVGEYYDFAISEDIAKKKPWSLVNDRDTYPFGGGVVRAFVLPHGIAFRIERNAPKELGEAVEHPTTNT